MSEPQFKNWQAIQAEVLRRIHARDWPPGHTIPNEVDLAAEFGCARATVNRALQSLADAGLLERRRKAGTRVALHPVSKATVEIPVIRKEIQELGQSYGYRLISHDLGTAASLLKYSGPALHVAALHTSSDQPYAIEDRWINLNTVPAAQTQDFSTLSANEWLLTHAPYTHGDISFAAEPATAHEAALLNTVAGRPVFVIRRLTWDEENTVTSVRLTFAPGYRIRTSIGA